MPNPWWNAPFSFTSCLLLAYFIEQHAWSLRLQSLLIASLAFVSAIIIIAITIPIYNIKSDAGRHLPEAVASILQKQKKTSSIFTNTWLFADNYWLASLISYYSPYHSKVYVANLTQGKQFYLWWQSFLNKQQQTYQQNKNITYFTTKNQVPQSHELASCKLIQTVDYPVIKWHQPHSTISIYIYRCRHKQSW